MNNKDKENKKQSELINFDIRDLDKEDVDNFDIPPEEMYKILKEISGGNIPAPMIILVKYSPELECITGKSEEEMFMSNGTTFQFLLESILSSYPQLEERYGPGKLCFQVNEKPPQLFDPLFDGDIVKFFRISSFLKNNQRS